MFFAVLSTHLLLLASGPLDLLQLLPEVGSAPSPPPLSGALSSQTHLGHNLLWEVFSELLTKKPLAPKIACSSPS